MKSKILNRLASETVGDGKNPNLFFVSMGADVQMIAGNFNQAYKFWKTFPRNKESMLEDRKYGVICSTEPVEDGSKKLVTYDDSESFLK